MTPFDLTQCPPPEGWGPWKEDDDFASAFVLRGGDDAVYLRQPTGLPAGQWQLCAEKGDDYIVIYTTLSDLPSVYRRALVAVGLASPWTSEVPTQPGLYAVVNADHTPVGVFVRDDGAPCWLGHDGRRHPVEFPNGARFCRVPQPPKERP